MKMQAARKQQGFTIIELVVVILLLGILAATALPRFINVTDEAHDAAFDGVLGGFTTGIALFRAQHVGKGQPASVAIDNVTLPFNVRRGYPRITATEGTAAAAIATDIGQCVTIFNNVLQSGRPTLVLGDIDNATTGTQHLAIGNPPSTTTGTVALTTLTSAAYQTQTADFQIGFHVGTAESAADAGDGQLPVCYYVYTGQYANATTATAAGRTGLPFFTYSANGDIRVGVINTTQAVFSR
ncbi:MAG: type II secretion system protein [Pseudohongiella sp.]|nr:type II secretion system protein [Pseudohongiella sp.]